MHSDPYFATVGCILIRIQLQYFLHPDPNLATVGFVHLDPHSATEGFEHLDLHLHSATVGFVHPDPHAATVFRASGSACPFS